MAELCSNIADAKSEVCSEEKQKFIPGKGKWTGAPPEKRRAPWRYDEATGKYNDKPIDKDYFNQYMLVRVNCPRCGRSLQRGNLSNHKKTTICLKNAKSIETH